MAARHGRRRVTGWRVAAWAAVVHVAALARLWRAWWLAASLVTLAGVGLDAPRIRDGGTLLMAVLIVVLAWRGPTWWREAGE